MIRVIVPDSHGCYIDRKASQAFLGDLKILDPDEIVMLGDHTDCASVFSSHRKNDKKDLEYSYLKDVEATSGFLDSIQRIAPKSLIHYLEGNHENRIMRWIANTFPSIEDASLVNNCLAPEKLLKLKQRRIKYYYSHEFYHGLSNPGTIKLGKCYFVHGISANKHAAATHVERFGANIVFGHIHRAQAFMVRTISSGEIGGWCPGTLSELQPIYLHSNPSNWTHGYGVQFVNKKSGTFLHLNVPIVRGKSLLLEMTNKIH